MRGIDDATDASVYSAAVVHYSSAERKAWFQAMLPTPQPLRAVWLRASVPDGEARFNLTVLGADGVTAVASLGTTRPVAVTGGMTLSAFSVNGSEYSDVTDPDTPGGTAPQFVQIYIII